LIYVLPPTIGRAIATARQRFIPGNDSTPKGRRLGLTINMLQCKIYFALA
jgi:hypothetical protein